MMYLCGAGVSSSGQATCPKEKCVGETGDGTVKSDQFVVACRTAMCKLMMFCIIQGYDSLLNIDDVEKKALAQPPENRSAVSLD